MKPILIVKAGTTFAGTTRALGDFEDCTSRGIGLSGDQVRVVAAYENGPLPAWNSFSGVVVTGSHSMVTSREAWSKELAKWIPDLIEQRIPFLGLCYGHRLLAYAMGGEVGNHPRGREIGTVRIRINDSIGCEKSGQRTETRQYQCVRAAHLPQKNPAECTEFPIKSGIRWGC